MLVLTRELVRPHLTRVTVAPITTNARGLSTEVPVGSANGLDAASVVSCDNIVTVPSSALGRRIGTLLPAQEGGLTDAIHAHSTWTEPPDPAETASPDRRRSCGVPGESAAAERVLDPHSRVVLAVAQIL